MKRIFKDTYKIALIIAVVFLVFLSVMGGVGGNAYAAFADSKYTNVMDDLFKDTAFNIDDYPAIADDYSLQVIQIAESTSGELFVYVYQPAALEKPLTATKINMSLTEDFSEYDYDDNIDDSNNNNGNDSGFGGTGGGGHGGGGGSFHSLTSDTVSTALYGLTLLNRTGVFAKYKVSNFTISSDSVRYYNISSISRDWLADIDGQTGSEQTINSKSFPVGRVYAAKYENGKINYFCNGLDVVEIINPFSSFIRYLQGYVLWKDACDAHYVAFSTDYDITRLRNATVASFVLIQI